MRNVFVIGLVLLLLSAYPLYWMAVEIIVSERAYRRYSMQQQSGANYDYKSAEFRGHRAVFSDGPSLDGKPSILTTIDGKDYSLRSPVELDDRGGYNSWAAMVTLTISKRIKRSWQSCSASPVTIIQRTRVTESCLFEPTAKLQKSGLITASVTHLFIGPCWRSMFTRSRSA